MTTFVAQKLLSLSVVQILWGFNKAVFWTVFTVQELRNTFSDIIIKYAFKSFFLQFCDKGMG